MTKVVFDESGVIQWGPVRVELIGEVERTYGVYRALRVSTPYRELNIYVSPTGRTLRVFRNTVELVGLGE